MMVPQRRPLKQLMPSLKHQLINRVASPLVDGLLRALLATRAGRWLQARAMAHAQATRRAQVAQP